MKLLTLILVSMLDIIPGGQAYMKQLQPRDSILIADQIEYGFQLDSVRNGTSISLMDFAEISNDTLTLVRGWQLDTLKATGRRKDPASRLFNIRGSVVLAPFEEGSYKLPDVPVRVSYGEKADTLLFEGLDMEVRTMPVDTAGFEIHDIKGQMRYPLTFSELAPWLLGFWLLAVLVIVAVCLIITHRRKESGETAVQEPAYIVALRNLEKYRGDRYWAPEKQKMFYSGITDTLKTYIDERYSIDAPEMTTAELFAALKGNKDLTPELYNELKDLFERADFVKFAKHVADDDENARALPLAVRFVTTTYQTELEEENVL